MIPPHWLHHFGAWRVIVYTGWGPNVKPCSADAARWSYMTAELIFKVRSAKCRPTVCVTGKGGIWRTKPPDAESASWGRDPESAGAARTCPVHAVLGNLCAYQDAG